MHAAPASARLDPVGRSSVDPFRTTRRERRGTDPDGIELVDPRAELFGPGAARGFDTSVTAPPVHTTSTGHGTGADPTAHRGDDGRLGPTRGEEAGAAPFGDGPGRFGAWSTVLAVAAVIGLVTVAVAPWRSSHRAAAPTTTRRATPGPATSRPVAGGPATSGPAPSPGVASGPTATDDAPGQEPGPAATSDEGPLYVLDTTDLPGHPTPIGGSRTDVAASSTLRTSWIGLWSTPYATRTDGSWVLAEVDPERLGGWQGQDRVNVGLPAGKTIGMHTVSADGVHRLLVEIGGRTLTLLAHGWDEGALAGLAAQATITDGRATFPPGAFPAGEAAMLDQPALDGLARAPVRPDSLSAEFFGPRDDEIILLTAPHDTAWDLIAPLLRSGDGLSTGPNVHHTVGGRNVVVTSLDSQFLGQHYEVAEWTEADRTIALVSRRPLAEILALVAKVRPGSDAEWTSIEQTNVSNDDGTAGDTTPVTIPAPLTEGTAQDGTAWILSVNADATSASVSLPPTLAVGPALYEDLVFPLDPADPLQVRAGTKLTLVTCLLPAAQAPPAMHVVTVNGPVDVPFLAVGTSGQVVAAYAFSELGRYSVHVERTGMAALDAAYGPGS
jgi:hypothetical protein